MNQRGRKSAAQLSIIKVDGIQRPDAPIDLLPDELELWHEIVNARVPDFFDGATLPLLKEYVRLVSQVELMAIKIEEFEPEWLNDVEGCRRMKVLTGIRDQAQNRMIGLTRSMRLTQQARYVPDKKANTPGKTGLKPWQSV